MIIPPDDASELGPIEETQIEALYQRLDSLRLELDPDPLELGPKRLNEKIAACRGHLSACEGVFAHLSQILHRYRRNHRKEATDYKLRMQDMLTNDVEVRGGRASSDREAIAATKLRTHVARIEILSGAVQDLEAVMVVVKAKRDDLKDIQRRLKDQQNMCREEISLGGTWGRRRPGASPAASNAAPRSGMDEVDTLMDQVLAQRAAETPAAPAEDPDYDGPPLALSGEEEAPVAPLGEGADADYDALLSEAPAPSVASPPKPVMFEDDVAGLFGP